MEIKLGIAQIARELTIETNESAEDITARLDSAIANDGVLVLHDVNGRQVIVPAARLGYIELGSPHARPVGFGAV